MVQTSWKERDRAQANLDFATGKLVIPGDKFPPQTQQRLVSAYPSRLGCPVKCSRRTRTISLRASVSLSAPSMTAGR